MLEAASVIFLMLVTVYYNTMLQAFFRKVVKLEVDPLLGNEQPIEHKRSGAAITTTHVEPDATNDKVVAEVASGADPEEVVTELTSLRTDVDGR